MIDKELALGITAVGIIGGLGFVLLNDSGKNKDDHSLGYRRSPSSPSERLNKLRKSNKAKKKIKDRLDRDRLELSDLNQALNMAKGTTGASEIPAVLWATMRAVFLNNHRRHAEEKTNPFINRVFSSYEIEGLSRREAISRAFAIAIKGVQEKGLITPGSQAATELGEKWQSFYQRDIGQKEYSKRFSEFEAIIRLGEKG